MNITRKQREQLCLLSENSFGSKYAWLSYLRSPLFEREFDEANNRFIKQSKWRTIQVVVKMMDGDYEAIFGVKDESEALQTS